MYTLGIIMLEAPFDLELSGKIDSYGFKSKEIIRKDQLNEVNGIVINVNQAVNNHIIKGLEWLTNFRKENVAIPIWLYTDSQLTQVEQKLCLHLGANGILIKDSETEENEFVIIKNTLNCLVHPETPTKISTSVTLNKNAQSVLLNGRSEIFFTRLEFRTFTLLYDHVGEVVTYQEISNYLWKGEQAGKGGRRYRVANLIFLIRKKLGEEGKSLIRTVRSKGFQLN